MKGVPPVVFSVHVETVLHRVYAAAKVVALPESQLVCSVENKHPLKALLRVIAQCIFAVDVGFSLKYLRLNMSLTGCSAICIWAAVTFGINLATNSSSLGLLVLRGLEF